MHRLNLVYTTLLLLALIACPIALKGSAASSVSSSSIKPRSLCRANERVVWSCETVKDRKLASICSSKDLNEARGYVQYRFGQPGRVEMEFPSTPTNTQAAFKYSRYTRPLVTYLRLVFVNNGFTHAINDDFNNEEKPARRDASITVTPASANAKETTLRCRQPITGSLMKLEDVVQKEEYTQ